MYRSIIIISLTLLLLGCGGGGSSSGDDFSTSGGAPTSEDCPSNMECGLLSVPKNYANDNGEKVDIYYGVHKAADTDNRIGILMFNFGGPGAEAVWNTSIMAEYFLPTEILDRFDIVGIDPRGAGKSAYSQTLTDCAVAQSEGSGSCDSTYAEIAPYLGSNTIVNDIDQLRSFLGEDKLNFLGYSYGTRLGSLYANAFPENVRAIVLDSSMPPASTNYIDLRLGNTAGYDLIVDYRLDSADRKLQYESIIDSVINNSIYIDKEGVSLSLTEAFSALYLTVSREYSGYWQAVKTGVFELLDDDLAEKLKTQLTNLDDSITSDDETLFDDLRSDALFEAVVCTDESQPLSAQEIAATEGDFETASALFGLYNFYGSDLCAEWPAQRDPIAVVENMDQVLAGQQILIIGGKYDPATPYEWATKMVDSFADLASFITVDELVSHGFSYTGIDCVSDRTTQYLLDPTIEIADVTCSGTIKNRSSLSSATEVIHPAKRAAQGRY